MKTPNYGQILDTRDLDTAYRPHEAALIGAELERLLAAYKAEGWR